MRSGDPSSEFCSLHQAEGFFPDVTPIQAEAETEREAEGTSGPLVHCQGPLVLAEAAVQPTSAHSWGLPPYR